MELLGRASELGACRSALGADPRPAGAVICGEPGIGKTTLFRAVIDLAATSGCRVLTTTGVLGEVDAPLANLSDLLDPSVGEVLDQLPAVQADALRVALRLAPVAARVDEALIVRATVNAL